MDIWKSIEDRYKFPKFIEELEEKDYESEENRETVASKIVSVGPNNRKQNEWNVRVNNTIICGLTDSEFTKVM